MIIHLHNVAKLARKTFQCQIFQQPKVAEVALLYGLIKSFIKESICISIQSPFVTILGTLIKKTYNIFASWVYMPISKLVKLFLKA